jgi:hypothetical protein
MYGMFEEAATIYGALENAKNLELVKSAVDSKFCLRPKAARQRIAVSKIFIFTPPL